MFAKSFSFSRQALAAVCLLGSLRKLELDVRVSRLEEDDLLVGRDAFQERLFGFAGGVGGVVEDDFAIEARVL